MRQLSVIFIVLLVSAWFLTPPSGARAQAESLEVVVSLLDESGQGLSGVTVSLILLRYAQAIEEVPSGSCTTGEDGACSILVAAPPRAWDGRVEGWLIPGSYGRQLFGGAGNRIEVRLQLLPGGLLATVPPPLDAPYEGQTEQPTDGPAATTTSTPTLAPSATPILATLTVAQSDTPLPPTATPVPAPSATDIPLPTATLPPPPPAGERMGLLPIGCGVIAFAVVGVGLFIAYRKQKSRQGA